MPVELVDLFVEIIKDTPDAVLASYGGVEVWIPRSQIDEDESDMDPESVCEGDIGTLYIPRWLAEREGLV